MKKRHFTYEERQKIEEGIKNRLTLVEMGEKLSRPWRSVQNEINRRCRTRSEYSADAAQAHAEKCKIIQHECAKRELNEEQVNIVIEGVKNSWSLQKIANQIGFGKKKVRDWIKENPNLTPITKYSVIERLETLEQQVELLSNLIEEMHK